MVEEKVIHRAHLWHCANSARLRIDPLQRHVSRLLSIN